MLKLEEQVCSLELAKRLKELNCKQESIWYWVKQPGGKWLIMRSPDGWIEKGGTLESYWRTDFYSAFTVSEIYQMYYEKFGTMNKIPVEISGEELADYMAQLLIDKFSA